MNVPEEQVRAWMRVIDHHLRRYRRHPDHEDIVAIGYATLARLLRSPLWERDGGGIGLILTCVNRAVVDFLESPQNRMRRYNRDRQPAVQWVSLDENARRWAAGRAAHDFSPRVPDFVPPLLDRLEVERRLARLPPRKRAALVLHHLHGLTHAETARALGCSEPAVRRACARPQPPPAPAARRERLRKRCERCREWYYPTGGRSQRQWERQRFCSRECIAPPRPGKRAAGDSG